jgi:hypothetical protein
MKYILIILSLILLSCGVSDISKEYHNNLSMDCLVVGRGNVSILGCDSQKECINICKTLNRTCNRVCPIIR